MSKLYSSIILTALWSCIQCVTAQDKFNLGGDISMLSAYEKVNTPYYDTSGSKINPLTYLRDNIKMNSMRVRLFVTPNAAEAKDGVIQDLEYVMQLGKRIKQAGMNFMLDFHYSDTWADPANQNVPSTWYKGTLSATNPSDATLTDSLYNYTKRCLQYLVANEAAPDYVQIGNEISYGMLWRTNADKCYTSNAATHATWKRLATYLNSAAKAVREVVPNTKIILHIERSGQSDVAKGFFARMKYYNVDYDIIGLSYYPFYHGYLPALSTTLNKLADAFPEKPVQIVETAYFYQNFTSQAEFVTTDKWAATVEGQGTFIDELCTELAKHPNVTGLYYWFPEENGNGGASWSASTVVINAWLNRGLWNNSTHKANASILKLKNFLTKKEAASVPSVNSGKTTNSGIYDLMGRRLGIEPPQGIFIKNGVKIVK